MKISTDGSRNLQWITFLAVREIVDEISPKMIICYGVRKHTCETASAFQPFTQIAQAWEYDILVVLENNQTYNDHNLRRKITRHNSSQITFNPIAHRLKGILDAIRVGNDFFYNVLSGGTPLYCQLGDSSLLENHLPVKYKSRSAVWNRHFSQALQFFKGAQFHLASGNPKTVAFNLHQTIEQACIAIAFYQLGYRTSFHNLIRLIDLTKIISDQPSLVLLGSTKKDQELFRILANAYTDARYGEDFRPSLIDMEIMVGRVEQFLAVINRIHLKTKLAAGQSLIAQTRTIHD